MDLPYPHQSRLPPPASPAPMARRRARHWYSALGSGFGSRHGVFLLSLSYISRYVSLSLDRQIIELLRSFSFTLNNITASFSQAEFCYKFGSEEENNRDMQHKRSAVR